MCIHTHHILPHINSPILFGDTHTYSHTLTHTNLGTHGQGARWCQWKVMKDFIVCMQPPCAGSVFVSACAMSLYLHVQCLCICICNVFVSACVMSLHLHVQCLCICMISVFVFACAMSLHLHVQCLCICMMSVFAFVCSVSLHVLCLCMCCVFAHATFAAYSNVRQGNVCLSISCLVGCWCIPSLTACCNLARVARFC